LGDDSWPTAAPELSPAPEGDPDSDEDLAAKAEVDASVEEDANEPDLLPPAAVATLLREHWTLPEPFVAEIEARLPFHVSRDVLLSAARRGMWTAARRFDPSRGVPFAAFVKQRIAGAIVDELRAERFVLRRHHAERESGHLRAMLSACSYDARFNELTAEEVAWLAAWRNVAGVGALPVRGEVRLTGVVDEDVAPADKQLDTRRVLAALEEAVAGLEPIQRRLVEKVGFEGCTIEEAAQPLSKSWGSRLYSTAISTLKRAMLRAGYAELFAPGALSGRSTFRGPAQMEVSEQTEATAETSAAG
jgi:RNA polymerase sigma factor for flagellar operon FliA